MLDILIVDDEADIRALIGDILEDEGFSTHRVGSAQACLQQLERELPKMIILDIWLKDSDMDGLDILKRVKKTHPHIPVVIISGHGNIEIAVGAIKQGAFDFIEKPFNIDQLLVVTRRAMEVAGLRRENTALRKGTGGKTSLAPMVGQSAVFKTFLAQVTKLAQTNARVLLHGPVGAGKTRAAQEIHAASNRKDAPFIRISCASLSAQVESKGTFDSAPWHDADGGVVYLDAIVDLSESAQAVLFRLLSDRNFAFDDAAGVDVRVVSSHISAQKPAQMRQDLFDRLAVVPLEVPPLVQRRDDIGVLAEHFLGELAKAQDLPLRRLGNEALAVMQSQPWVGNLRQLRNTLERLLILGGRDEISADEVALDPASDGDRDINLDPAIVALPLRGAREAFEKAYLAAQIARFDGNISKTAQFVGMERSALHRKIRALGIGGAE